jgi:hypothetical protein
MRSYASSSGTVTIRVRILMHSLSIIVVGELTNKLLTSEGWQVGDPVHRMYNGYGGDTFGRAVWPQVDAYLTPEGAQAEIDARGTHFSGVTFKVVTFDRRDDA